MYTTAVLESKLQMNQSSQKNNISNEHGNESDEKKTFKILIYLDDDIRIWSRKPEE